MRPRFSAAVHRLGIPLQGTAVIACGLVLGPEGGVGEGAIVIAFRVVRCQCHANAESNDRAFESLLPIRTHALVEVRPKAPGLQFDGFIEGGGGLFPFARLGQTNAPLP